MNSSHVEAIEKALRTARHAEACFVVGEIAESHRKQFISSCNLDDSDEISCHQENVKV